MSKNTTSIIIIPARLASTRLPNKPLAEIGGEAMILHIARRAENAGVGEVYVAAGDSKIVEVVEAAGFNAILTDPALPSGSDRCVAALKILAEQKDLHPEWVINLQGDMPNISTDSIRKVHQAVKESECDCATLVHPCAPEHIDNPNQVKAVLGLENSDTYPRCLYFSRQAVPAGGGGGGGVVWGHIGIYAWRFSSLIEFASLPPTLLEEREKLEQLRALEHQMTIRAAKTTLVPLSVDSLEDLEHARKVMNEHN